MRKAGRAIVRCFLFFERWAPAVLLGCATVLGLLQVGLRYFFGTGITWSTGVLIAFTVWAAFIGAGAATATGELVRFDLVIAKVAGRHLAKVNMVVDILLAVFVLYLLVLAIRFTRFEAEFSGVSVDTNWPVWVEFAGEAVVLAMIAVRYISRVVVAVRRGWAA